MEYRGREDSDYMDKEDVAELLKTSKDDYKSYQRTHKVSFLRDASQKLYEAMLNYGEWLYNARYTKLSQFTGDFYSSKKKVPISEQEKHNLVASAWLLHEFAYHGPEEEFNIKEYENRYNEFYRKLHFLLGHTEKRELIKV